MRIGLKVSCCRNSKVESRVQIRNSHRHTYYSTVTNTCPWLFSPKQNRGQETTSGYFSDTELIRSYKYTCAIFDNEPVK